MNQTLSKNWGLVGLCGVLDAIVSGIYFSHAERGFHTASAVMFLGKATLAAGVCTIAAGVWSSRDGRPWLLALNGVIGSVLGLVLAFWTGPLAFRTVAMLVAAMAMSIGTFELGTARLWRRPLADEWLVGAAGAASIGFALVFLGFAFRWIALEPRSPGQTLLWLGSYFGVSALGKLMLVRRRHGLSAVPTLGNPRFAH